MKITIINLANGTVNVHAAECKDCIKDSQIAHSHGGISYTIEAANRLDVSKDFWADQIEEESMTAEQGLCEFNFKPCCKDLPVA